MTRPQLAGICDVLSETTSHLEQLAGFAIDEVAFHQ